MAGTDQLTEEWKDATRRDMFYRGDHDWSDEEWERHGRYDADVLLGVLDELPWLTKRRRALDFGCGDGRVSKFLHRSAEPRRDTGFGIVGGIDIRDPKGSDGPPKVWNPAEQLDFYVQARREGDERWPDAVRRALKAARQECVADDAPQGGTFDLVFSLLTLQHNTPEDAEEIIAALIDVLAPGGVLYFDLRDHWEQGPVPALRGFLGNVRRRVARWFGKEPYQKAVHELSEQRVERIVKRSPAYIHTIHRHAESPRGVARYVYVIVRPRTDLIPEKETRPSIDPPERNVTTPDYALGEEVLRAHVRSPDWIRRRDTSVRFVDDVVIEQTMLITASADAYQKVASPTTKAPLLPLALLSKNLLTDLDITDADGTHVPWLIRRYNNWVAWSVLVVAARNVLGGVVLDDLQQRLRAVAFADHRRARAILRALDAERLGSKPWQRDLDRVLRDDYFAKLLFDLAYNWMLLVPRPAADVSAAPARHADRVDEELAFKLTYVECLEWNPWHAVRGYRNTFSTFFGGPYTLLDRSRGLGERRKVLWQCAQMALGLTPIRIVLAAPSFADCQSFHMTPEAPPGLKIIGARLHARTVDGRRWIWHGAAGGQKGHVYAKPRPWSYGGKVDIELVPRPRGAARHSMIAALASAVILTCTLFMLPNVFALQDRQTPVALLVALPGVIAAVLSRSDDHEISAAVNPGAKGLLALIGVIHLLAGVALLSRHPGVVLPVWLALTAVDWVLALATVTAYFEPLRSMQAASRRRTLSPVVKSPARCRVCGLQVALRWDDEDILDEQDFVEAFDSESFLFLAPSAEGQRAGFRDARTVEDATRAAWCTAGVRDRYEHSDNLPSAYPAGEAVCRRLEPIPRPDRAALEFDPKVGSLEHTVRWVVLLAVAAISDVAVRRVTGWGYRPGPHIPVAVVATWAGFALIAAFYGLWRLRQREKAIDRARSFRVPPGEGDPPPPDDKHPRLRRLIRYKSAYEQLGLAGLDRADCHPQVVSSVGARPAPGADLLSYDVTDRRLEKRPDDDVRVGAQRSTNT